MHSNTRHSYFSSLHLALIICTTFISATQCEYSERTTEMDATEQIPPLSARKRRHNRRKQQQKKKALTFKSMSYDELVERKDILVEEKNTATAIKFLKRIITLCPDARKLAGHLIELADILFDGNHHEKACKVYREFLNLYPGDERIEYVLYRAICASFNCTNTPDRDQTPTHETLELVELFLSRSSIFTTYTKEVTKIQHECYEKLVASELNICRFYHDRKEQNLVEKRLAYIDTEWGSLFEPTKTMIQAFKDPSGSTSLQQADESGSGVVVAQTSDAHMANRF